MVLAQSPEIDLTEEERAWLKEHPEIANSLSNIGIIDKLQGDYF
jgi:hypothetical protein